MRELEGEKKEWQQIRKEKERRKEKNVGQKLNNQIVSVSKTRKIKVYGKRKNIV